MNIASYLDSTYLKLPSQSGLSESQTKELVLSLTQEAIDHGIYAVMIRPSYVELVKSYLDERLAKVKIGTVIGFHQGDAPLEEKLLEAQTAIDHGVDELDYVINYSQYKRGNFDLVSDEFLKGTKLGLENGKVVKWIIEIAALSNEQIAGLTALLSTLAQANFSEQQRKKIFVKSSTGFFKTPNGEPNGATVEGITLMKQNAGDLPLKAAGGVRSPEEARAMIELGVTRIGTSSALALLGKTQSSSGY